MNKRNIISYCKIIIKEERKEEKQKKNSLSENEPRLSEMLFAWAKINQEYLFFYKEFGQARLKEGIFLQNSLERDSPA